VASGFAGDEAMNRQEILDRLSIYLRVHSAKVPNASNRRRKRRVIPEDAKVPPIWPEYALIFDTETRTTVDQTLMFGIYRICKLVDGKYLCEREGIVYDERLSNKELNTIGTFVLNTFPEIEAKRFPPQLKLEVHKSFPAFMERIFFPTLRKGWLISGFNLPFDISRLSIDWHKTREDGFALVLSRMFWKKYQQWGINPYRPEIRIRAKDARTSFIKRGKTKKPKQWPNPARPLDISTLLFALYDEHGSVKSWCHYFREERGYEWVHEKEDHEPCGQVALDELKYCRRDVLCTQDLLNCAKIDLDLYGLSDLPPDKAYSPASLGKACFRAMNIVPPAKKFQTSNELQGIFMQAYFGGRAECHIRKINFPILKLDFLSQYPTVNTLLDNWKILTAESVSYPECTAEIRLFLNSVDPRKWLDKCFERETWPELRFFALVRPRKDMFPVRAPYKLSDPDRLNIGLNYFTSEKPLWFAGPDIVSSIVLTGKVPEITKAIRIVPHGQQPEMRPLKLRSIVEVDPYTQDLFKKLIEQRKANEGDKVLKHAIKVIANATAYGAFVELNEQSEPRYKYRMVKGQKKRVREFNNVIVSVHSGEHEHKQQLYDLEVPGEMYFPPLASLITSGGRLLLAMAEASVIREGSTFLACDTDSIFAVATLKGGMVPGARRSLMEVEGNMNMEAIKPIGSLSHATVKKIAGVFRSLNPYRFGGDLLKIEDINYKPDKKGKPTNQLRTIHTFSISSKRYAIREGKKIVEVKGHGLGYLMSPTSKEGDDWMVDAWEYVLKVDAGGHIDSEPEWLDYPAMMRIPVSSPAVLGRLKGFCKPYDFVLAPIIRDSKLDPETQAEKPILITRFSKHSDEWGNATYYNVRTAKECRVTTGESNDPKIVPVKSYREILHQYLCNPESKFNGPDGKPCDPWTRGVLRRRYITAGAFNYCGKEFRRKLEQGPVDHELDFKVNANSRVSAEPEVLRDLNRFSERDINSGTGLSRRIIRHVRHGGQVKRSTMQKITDFLSSET
jgi:hypothetical protein